jgi:hypothetical protein
MVYIAAGRADGVREGAEVRVLRLGDRGVYRVTYLSSKSAACLVDSLALLPEVGDSVVFVPAAPDVVAGYSATGTRSSVTTTSRRRGASLRGRIGARFLGSWDRASGASLRQPGLELLLDGPVAPGAPVGLSVDIRSRRISTYRANAAQTSRTLMGVYQAAMRVQSPGGPVRAVVGRQYAPTLAGIGLFDGVTLDLQRPTWGIGVMAGVEPEPGTLALSSEIQQAGGYLQLRTRPGGSVRWTLSAGALGSYSAGEVNREFAFLQTTIGSRVFNAVLLQEVDMNRGWKIAAGEKRVELTSSFASVNLTPARWLTLSGGRDSRRNVRLYRDLLTPEDEFDDRFRIGVWGGVHLTIGSRLRLGADVRSRTVDGADSLRTTAYSATISLDRITALGIGLRARATRYDTPSRGPGSLFSGTFRLAPVTAFAVELNAGGRQEQLTPTSDRFWAGANLELLVRRSWFALVSFTREWGRDNLTPTTEQLYAGLSYRF